MLPPPPHLAFDITFFWLLNGMTHECQIFKKSIYKFGMRGQITFMAPATPIPPSCVRSCKQIKNIFDNNCLAFNARPRGATTVLQGVYRGSIRNLGVGKTYKLAANVYKIVYDPQPGPLSRLFLQLFFCN